MAVSYYAHYHGEAVDRVAFFDQYCDVHVPIFCAFSVSDL